MWKSHPAVAKVRCLETDGSVGHAQRAGGIVRLRVRIDGGLADKGGSPTGCQKQRIEPERT
jgi:hypothetical protein